MTIEVRHAIPDDAEALTEVNIRSIREICGASGDYTPEQIEHWISNKSPTSFLKWMANEDMRLYTGLIDDVVSGVGLLDLSGQIILLVLTPEAQGKGLGKALLHEMEAEARYWDLSKLTLESTTVARPFYESQGYRNLGPTPRKLRSFQMEKTQA